MSVFDVFFLYGFNGNVFGFCMCIFLLVCCVFQFFDYIFCKGNGCVVGGIQFLGMVDFGYGRLISWLVIYQFCQFLVKGEEEVNFYVEVGGVEKGVFFFLVKCFSFFKVVELFCSVVNNWYVSIQVGFDMFEIGIGMVKINSDIGLF